MIGIITGTLNRGPLLPRLIENTVEANENLELVLKVCSLFVDKVANYYYDDVDIYNRNRKLYENKVLPDNLEFLQ